MINIRYNRVRTVAPANSPSEEPVVRGCGRGRRRVKSTGRGRGRVEPIKSDVPNDYVSVNENPLAHDKVIGEDKDVENVQEVKNVEEEGGKVEAIGIPPIDLVLA